MALTRLFESRMTECVFYVSITVCALVQDAVKAIAKAEISTPVTPKSPTDFGDAKNI